MTTPVGADPGVVGPYLATVLGDEKWRSVNVELIAAGMSNLTYVVTPQGGTADDAVILRRPPTGAVLATAHDMVREHRVISALADTPVPVPRTLHLATDTSVLGAPFYVMERVVGVHVVTELPPGYADEPAQRRQLADGLMDTLADLHAVDPAAVGLADFGRPEGFLERQVRRWTKQWDATRDAERPALDALAARLAETVPTSQRSRDHPRRLPAGQLPAGPDHPGRIRAVLDWEMSTLGDPLTDLGMLFVYWPQAGEGRDISLSQVTTLPGFPTRQELAERYAAPQRRRPVRAQLVRRVRLLQVRRDRRRHRRPLGRRRDGRQGHHRVRGQDRSVRRAGTRRTRGRCALAAAPAARVCRVCDLAEREGTVSESADRRPAAVPSGAARCRHWSSCSSSPWARCSCGGTSSATSTPVTRPRQPRAAAPAPPRRPWTLPR